MGELANPMTPGISAFSATTQTATLDITPVADTPRAVGNAVVLPDLTLNPDATTNSGATIASLLGGLNIVDPDTAGASYGLAVTGLGGTGWQYSTEGGTTWNNITRASATSSLLLESTARVRFHPAFSSTRPFQGVATLSFKVWDSTNLPGTSGQTRNTNGTVERSHCSVETVVGTVNVGNLQPVLTDL